MDATHRGRQCAPGPFCKRKRKTYDDQKITDCATRRRRPARRAPFSHRRSGVGEKKGGSRPVSRVLSWTAIPLGRTSPYASSDLPGPGAGRAIGSLFGLAPGGVYPATRVAAGAVRSYRTFSPLPCPVSRTLAVCFLWHFPSARAAQELPGTLPFGARTFLPGTNCPAQLSGRLPPPIYSTPGHRYNPPHVILPGGRSPAGRRGCGCCR